MAQTVSEVMTSDPRTVELGDSLVDAARLMREEDVGNVIVAEEGQICGILTDRDIVVRAIADGRDPRDTKVGDACTSEPVSVSPEQDVDEAIRVMRERDVRRVPVVEDGRPVGILTLGDLATGGSSESDEVLADVSSAKPNN